MKPYGYVRKDGEGLFIYGEHQFQNAMGAELVPVYLHPKEWVGLTDEQKNDCPKCEYNKNRAARWRAEAYKQGGHDVIELPWVGLTDEEIWTVLQFRGYNTDTIEIARAVEARLKERNT
jgi:hypothetical protein